MRNRTSDYTEKEKSASKRGRSTQGRPKRGESVFADYAQMAASGVMRALAEAANERHFTLQRLAESMGKADPTALAASIVDSKRPRESTVVEMCVALGFPQRLGRALLRRLSSEDIEQIRADIFSEVFFRKAVFTDYEVVIAIISSLLDGVSKEEQLEGLSTFALADSGLRDPKRFTDQSLKSVLAMELVLSRALGSLAIAQLLISLGQPNALLAFVKPPEQRIESEREAAVLLYWIFEAIPLSARDRAAIRKIIQKFTSSCAGINLTGRDIFCLLSAQDAYRKAFRKSTTWKGP